MPSTYPTTLDTLATNKADATTAATDHPTHHNNMADAINKIEAELGTLPKGSYADVKTRLGDLVIAGVMAEIPLNVFTCPPSSAVGTGVFSGVGHQMCYPFSTARTITLTKFAVEVTTLVASSVIRLGLYSDLAGAPNALIRDCGTVASSTTGVKELTFTATVLTPGQYWLSAMTQTGASSPGIRTSGIVGYHISSLSSLLLPNLYTALANVTPNSGAMPGTFPAISSVLAIGNTPRIAIFRSA